MTDDVPLADELVSPLLRLLQALRTAGGGDLELHIILLAITERTVGHPDFRTLNEADRNAAVQAPFPTLGLNIRSIADSTGVPRETVRRKLASLTKAGWIVQTPQGPAFTAEAYRALTPAREEIERLALKFHEVVSHRKRRG
ncbi:helix-turn-helix domain-containing protein [Caulobacter sp.]|uniref:helix-turn-helix domain-containing protein n=1 Tax=Caulobacter sp. TaxID=78 RepID=UPI0031D6DCCF